MGRQTHPAAGHFDTTLRVHGADHVGQVHVRKLAPAGQSRPQPTPPVGIAGLANNALNAVVILHRQATASRAGHLIVADGDGGVQDVTHAAQELVAKSVQVFGKAWYVRKACGR